MTSTRRPSSQRRRGPRFWPATVVSVALLAALALIWTSGGDDPIRQNQVMASLTAVSVAALLLLLWALTFSRLRARSRALVLGGLVAALLAFFGLFRYRGVSGDLVPQFEMRFGGAEADLPDSGISLPGLADYGELLGPARDGAVSGLDLARDWSESPPTLLWRRPVGRGWSGFAVRGNVAVTHEQHGAEERVVAYELPTGKVRWASREVAHYENAIAGEGPRATPTIRDGRVYAMGGTGLLTALDLRTGERLWKRDVLADNGTKVPTWGKSDSPLVAHGQVVVSGGDGGGATLVAYDAVTGERLWRGGEDAGAYASPMLVTLGGVEQILTFNAASVSGHAPDSGALIWREPWPRRQPNVIQPVLLPDDRVLVSAGYGTGSKLFALAEAPGGELRAETLWESVRLKSKISNVVYHEGYVYGLDDGILVCLDPSDGRRRWKRGRYGHGQLLLVGGLIVLQGEHGEVFLIEPSPSELRELARFRAFDGKIWNPPALAGRYLLMRNDAEAALFALPVA